MTELSADPVAARWNGTIDFTEITMDRNFALFLVSLVLSITWVVYITYYNSRVLGFILTRLINKFYFQDENFKIGSFTLNALSGKIMFRDIVYINYDYTLRIQDGYLIFRWWRSYIPKDVSEDLSHSDTRVSIMLNGFELHVYNRSDMYHELEKIFDLEPFIKQNQGDSSVDQEKAMNDANEKRRRAQDAVRSEAAMARTWRDLIPVIKIDICSGRVVFGNRLIPTTLSISVEESHLMYSTKPPASSLDHLMHFVKAKAENCKVLLAPSPNYTALADEPPRFMGEGFVVMSSNYIELYFYMDEPGLVPEHPVLLQLANGDVVESAPPIWGVDIKCGKGTDFSYGPWADRQRDHLFKFFFPPNFKNLEITPQPKPGDRRQMQSFDIRLSTLNEATIDILFTKNKETNAVHINIGAGSYLEVTLPWIVLQDGYTTKITGQLLHLEATTSLQYRSLAESETLEYNVKCHYPLVWNHHQSWQLSFTGCKATAHFVYTHIDFFQDLVNDWATKARPDILSFVPYTWKISILLKECELVTLSNQYNWVDCSSTNQENNHVAFCGDLLDVSFDLPFVDFLPDVIPLKIWIQGESVDMSLYLPEVNTSRQLLLSIDKNMKITPCRLKPSKWRRKCVKAQGWVECWSVPIIALSIRYIYHPVPPLGPEPQADITTPEKEEILLSPMRIPRHQRKKPHLNWTLTGDKFDRTVLPPDKVSLELEVGPSILFVYGTIFTGFMHLLDNIFGEDQTFTDLQKAPTVNPFQSNENQHSKMQDRSSIQNADISLDDSSDSIKGPFDPRRYRPLDVTVSIIIHDIQAHLVKNCSENEPPCPIVLIERFGFEMDKSFKETKLQLLLSPSILISSNNSRTFSGQGPLHQGHLMLSSFQLRGHGFFSDTNRSVDEETVEYAWMMELQLGQLTGRVTLPQLYHVISFLETFALLIADEENELVRPNQIRNCHHGINNLVCPQTDHAAKYRCPSSNDIKYKMIRVGVDLIDVYLADTNTTLQTWLSPVRFSVCNLHGPGFGTGVTALIPNIKLALFTQTNMQSNTCHNSTGSNTSHIKMPENEKWVGVGSVTLGPVLFEAASSLPQVPNNLHIVQQKFLKLHDEKTKRLWYLWNNDKTGLCGCNGGCSFFGSNRNGLNFYRPNPTDLQQGVNVAMFNVLEVLGEYGYGQSLLHPGQLVFHTPPYNSLNVCLQPAVSLIPSPLPQFLNKSPQSLERRSITRRFSYTSINKGSNNMVSSTKSDVPYARLVDTSMSLGNSKIDSDSKLNKSVLCVPQMESSVSDSKLALNSGIKDQCSGINKKSPSIVESFTVPRTAAKAVAASESHYSLNYPIQPDEVMPLDAKRTTSITSENHSEAFFSADEETLPSRASSLKHSFRNSQKIQKERGLSVTDTGNMKLKAPVTKLDSDGLEIASLSTGLQADSESGSMSSNSFISAISSQEDMGLVNLNIQNSKPIIDSPLLMASYMQNLPQYKCSNWLNCSLPYGTDAFTLPLFRRTEDGSLIYVGQKYLPHFDPIGKANIFKLISKKDSANQHGPYSTLPPNFNSHNKSHPFPQAWWDLQQNTQDSQENNTDNSSITTVTTTSDSKFGIQIKLRGEVNVTLSPLVLESLQKFLESLTPVLANVHPITFISHMRLLCISSVMSSNVLKQNQNVQNWLPQLDKFHSLNQKDGKTKLSTITETNVYEENISDQTHATVNIPKINVIFIQSSVIEDMISFSALDNISDLTCVSLFGVSIENVTARFVSSKKTLESVQLFYRPTLKTSGSKKSFGIMKGPRALIAAQSSSRKVGQEKGEPVYVEAPVEQFEDTTFEITIGKLQGQFRQLPNESSQLKDVRITSIPPQHSKVSFNFIRLDNLEEEDIINKKETDSNTQFERLGHIMFECGIEGVSIKANKHSQTQKPTEEKIPLKADNESCRDSVKSDDIKQDKPKRTSGIEDLFRKKDSTSSKPSTPNLGATQTAPQVPPAEASTPGPEAESSNNSGGSTIVPKQDDNASSCSIDIKSVSFNFAAPPHTNVYKKHELSNMECSVMRVSRAVCAWQVPWGGANGEWARVNRASHSRRNASAAALMAHAIESHHSALQYLPKSRYGRHTFMGRTLREEPSLQLLTIILRFALHADAAALQADLAQRHLPSLSTLKQGVIVLCRQWKNILYTSLLLEHNFKNKAMKPLNVTFALPDLIEESNEGWQQYQLEVDPLDENCLLLDMDVEDGANPTAKSEKDSPRPASLPSATPPLSARAAQGRGSLGFPSFTLPKKSSFQDDNGANYGSLKEDMTAMGSDQSLSSHHGSNENVNDKAREDLYQWMAKQQPVHIQASESRPCSVGVRALRGCALYPVVGPGLLDAHLVFQPLLRALGVRATQLPTDETKAKLTGDSQPTLESLGSKLTLLAWMDSFKIDLVVSDAYDKKNKKTTKGPQSPYLSESGAFLSEKVCVEVEVKRVADMSVDDLVQRKNVLYISRGQLNKHISTIVNFNVSVRFLSQQVNMPLLRLLHQINDVYQNVKETQVEIRNRNKITRRESKHASSSVSDIQEEKPLSVSSLEKEWKYSPPASTEPLSRPQSFAQKLRSTGKTVKGKLGYSSLNEGGHTPLTHEPVVVSESIASMGPNPLPNSPERHLAPRCWQTVYQLLQLYAGVPDHHTITHRFSVSTDIPSYNHSACRRIPSNNTPSGIVVRGTARIHRCRALASLSGLKLETELTSLQASVTGSKARPLTLNGHIARATLLLKEGEPHQHLPVVRVGVGRSAIGLRISLSSDEGSLWSSVGPVRVDLPQHPVALHGLVARSSKHLSSTLQELGVTRGTLSRKEDIPPTPRPPPQTNTPHPLFTHAIQLNLMLQSLSITAALLPSLQAQYKMEQVHSSGVTGPKPHFNINLPQHSLSFVTKLQSGSIILPPMASISLPLVRIQSRVLWASGGVGIDGALLSAGPFLCATADIGTFDHTLSTDLLNHLVFAQKVFMKEVNEVVQKVYGGEKPVPLWSEDESSPSQLSKILFSLTIRIKRIQLTATTLSNCAVRLETGTVELHLSNRVQNITCADNTHGRLFAKVQVDLNLSLGQLIRNAMFEEVEPEYQQYAFFNTRIVCRNAFQEEMVSGEEKEVVLIKLRRPLVYIQPIAVDKAVLVWLNYKTAYKYWTEQRRGLNRDVLDATQQIFEKVQLTSQLSSPQISTLFLQLTVDDIGICLPLNQPPMSGLASSGSVGSEGRSCVVVTVEHSIVGAVSRSALVSQGRFVGLCLRFAHDFSSSLDDWRPSPNTRNLCRVSEGTYEVCSRTAAPTPTENAKWFLNVSWQMEGVDINLDVNVGKQLSALGHTLTMITGFEEDDPMKTDYDSDLDDEADISKDSQESIVVRRRSAEPLPAFVFDSRLDAKQRSRLIERELTEQAKLINDLRSLGASHSTVEHEMQRLHDLEAIAFKDFRRDMIQKIRRQSVRASSMTKEKFGLGSNRSHSFVAPHTPIAHDIIDVEPPLTLSESNELMDEEHRLADIIEGNSWSSVESELIAGPSRSASVRGRRSPPLMQRQSSLPADTSQNIHTNQSPLPPSPPPVENKNQNKKHQEPNVDFELDVKVHINSGKCVLHTKEIKDDDIKMGSRNRSSSGRDSPPTARRHRSTDKTVFRVPGLHTEVHYESLVITDSRRPTNKKASLFAWITLQSIPEETIISPHILDFLEQTLEPIPTKIYSAPQPESVGPSSEMTPSASFPVDVVVHFHSLPSTFRFSCLPASRVECRLRLPDLTIVFSSDRQSPSLSGGGVCVTGCVNDFSVHVFHPYGGVGQTRHQRKDSLSINVEFVKFHLARSRRLDHDRAVVRFSTIVDVGSASFKYDMRRLSEILAFPRAWYRRSIVRRMFLGDTNAHRHNSTGSRNAPVSPVMPQREKVKTVDHQKSKENVLPSTGSAEWETLVLFAVNFTRLNVQMNMGNVMGNVSWQSHGLQISGRLQASSNRRRSLQLRLALHDSALDARAGIVGGAFSIDDLCTSLHVSGVLDRAKHSCWVRSKSVCLRLEYMGASNVLARGSNLDATIRDSWTDRADTSSIILAHGKLSWHQLQLLISRSTTPDLIKMQIKLEEFFTQQFNSSKRVFNSLRPDYSASAFTEKKDAINNSGPYMPRLKHHRHWQKVLEQVLLLQTDSSKQYVVGGTMELQGSNISLACFHGNSFKAKSWALFSLKEPCISFATEAQPLNQIDGVGVHVVQSLTASLGSGSSHGPVSMATVVRMTRSVMFPPQFKTLHEWFHYAFAQSEIDAIEEFPTCVVGVGAPTGERSSARISREVIFALPAMQVHLRTRHEQGNKTPTAGDEKPTVECSFITEFEDHIFVSVDAEAFLFLHDLISSYIKEKDRVLYGNRGPWNDPPPSGSTSKEKSNDDNEQKESLTQDYRDYRCVTWHLEPTVRLLSWGGKSIEPYGVDYILQKLGFSHARTTIPKWLQRGTLDPLDKILSLAMLKLIAILPQKAVDK